MSSNNRYIEGEKSAVIVPVQGGVTVEIGDLMFYDNAVNLRNNGDSTATLYAYPIEYFRTSGASLTLNKTGVKAVFLGVSLTEKDGVTDSAAQNVAVATKGRFKYPLSPPRTVAVGEYFGAAGTTSASDLFNQKIMRVTDSSYALGLFSENKTHAQDAEVEIKTFVAGSTL